MMEGIKEVKREYQSILEKLSDPELLSNWDEFQTLSQKKEILEKIIDKKERLKELKQKIKESESILTSEEQELVSLAETEISQFKNEEEIVENEIENLFLDYKVRHRKNRQLPSKAVIVEIRAGTGGEEAALFSKDLFRMYSKFAQSQNWKQKILDSRPTGLDGFKEIIFELKGKDVYSKVKYEAGVHRVQRVPLTEKSGRIHTSTATVAVLPKPSKSEIKIKLEDIRIDFYRASGPGGQYVNKRDTAVRLSHLPTGIVVTSQTERSQLQNKENAMAILEAKILEKKREKEEKEISKKRKTQIGWAKRAEKIRTYNFPQNRITDHRIKKNWHNLEKILDGNLDSIIRALQK